MNKNLAIVMLLLFSYTGIIKAQTINTTPTIKNQKLSVLNFIKSISFTPIGILPSNFAPTVKASKFEENKILDISPNVIEQFNAKQFKYAMMMDVAVEFLSNLTLYKYIDDWYGTRYRMGGTTKKGIDCSAFTGSLLLCVYALSVPRTAKEQYNASVHINKEDLKEGDLVFFNTRGGVSHVGLYLSNNHFVHSSSSNGVMISNLDDPYFARRFITGGRVNKATVL